MVVIQHVQYINCATCFLSLVKAFLSLQIYTNYAHTRAFLLYLGFPEDFCPVYREWVIPYSVTCRSTYIFSFSFTTLSSCFLRIAGLHADDCFWKSACDISSWLTRVLAIFIVMVVVCSCLSTGNCTIGPKGTLRRISIDRHPSDETDRLPRRENQEGSLRTCVNCCFPPFYELCKHQR